MGTTTSPIFNSFISYSVSIFANLLLDDPAPNMRCQFSIGSCDTVNLSCFYYDVRGQNQ